MIPPNILREHVEKAIQEIDSLEGDLPSRRESVNYDVMYKGKRYPPKYVISLANKYANGSELPSNEFDAIDAKTFLPTLGFEIKLKFDIKPGDVIVNQQLSTLFQIGTQGGMRRSTTTNSLVLISDQTKSFYKDEWKGDILHYTGMGMTGDQDINYMQNRTLAESKTNGAGVHLFEVYEPGRYTYRGMVELAGEPYKKNQKDKNGNNRKVVIFPLALKKPDIPLSNTILFAKIGWSLNGWQGFDKISSTNKDNFGYKYVKENGIANEWWNFYDYGDEYYYGWIQAPGSPTRFTDGGLVLFASVNYSTKTFCFIGFYGNAEYGDFVPPKEILSTIEDPEIKNEYSPKLKEIKSLQWRGQKNQSCCFFKPIEFELSEIDQTNWGQAPWMYVGENETIQKKQVKKLLEKVIEQHEALRMTHSKTDIQAIQTTIDTTKRILSKYFSTVHTARKYWQVAPGPQAQYWDSVWKKLSIINIGYPELIDYYASRLAMIPDYESLKKELQVIAEENPDSESLYYGRSSAALGSNATMIWDFLHEVQVGDLIVVNRGRSDVIGVGVVKSPVKINKDLDYKFTRDVEWIEKDIQKKIPDELKGKFGKTISELTEEEYTMLVSGTKEPENPLFRTIDKVLDYKKQVILYGPPGTGKTYLAKDFVNSTSVTRENISISGDKKIYWYITNLKNWGSELQSTLENHEESEIWTKTQGNGEYLKDKSSFFNISPGDIVFVYITPEKRIFGVAQCSRKEIDSTGDPIVFLSGLKYFENGLELNAIKNDTILKEYPKIHNNLGTLFLLPERIGSRLLELTNVSLEEIGLVAPPLLEDVSTISHFVTFHPSYAYEEFIEGLRPINKDGNIVYEIHEGIFKKCCREALNALTKIAGVNHIWEDHMPLPMFSDEEIGKIQGAINQVPCYIIIDEINRGDISRIFGELITLIESDKRLLCDNEIRCKLPYSNMDFSIPPNLFIIGTMNTADRSISLMDIALRRRFGFIELTPDYEALENHLTKDPAISKEVRALRDLAIQSLKTVNERLQEKYDRDHQIGHSYLMKLQQDTSVEGSREMLTNIWKFEIIPLLQEYFYDSSEKLLYVTNNRFFEKAGTSFILKPEMDIIAALNALTGSK